MQTLLANNDTLKDAKMIPALDKGNMRLNQ